MVKRLIPVLLIASAVTSCSSIKPLNYSNNKPVVETSNSPKLAAKTDKEVRFLDDINVHATRVDVKEPVSAHNASNNAVAIGKSGPNAETANGLSAEKASAVQLKYAVLLNTEVEMLSDLLLLDYVDEWYGTKYRLGGTTKNGIDCSAFVQTVYLAAFGVSLPRTAREQYKTSRIISATDLKEGDLLFFNTTGGVSHVGIYLMNNKFIHASSSRGVTVSDIFDPYYLKKYLGAGRIEKPDAKLK
jgi:lipoprotein Spr